MEKDISTHDLTRRSTKMTDEDTAIMDISTHDLTRRSTPLILAEFHFYVHFNSRPHEEVDSNFIQHYVI